MSTPTEQPSAATAGLRAAAAAPPPAGARPEIVTNALVRDVDLPGGAGTLALITLDNGFDHTRPSTFGLGGLVALDDALDTLTPRARAGEIVAVGITGKPFVFCAGADLTMIGGTREAAEAAEVSRGAHAVFRRLGELPVPSFGFINGAALGGGLEVALHCTYRTVSTGVGALGLPECFLGLAPVWGGTYLLPNLIGPQAALQVMVTNALSNNKMLNGPKALALGIADAGFHPADFLEESLSWASAVLRGQVQVDRPEIDRDEATWTAALAETRAFVDAKLHGAAPAPYRALDLVGLARTADRDTAFAAESEVGAELAMSEELRSSLYAFDLVNKRAKKPAGAPDAGLARPITSVGVVGAGLMAAQLALLFARRLQVPVVMTDLDEERVNRGLEYVRGEITALLRRGRVDADTANRLTALVTGSVETAAFAGADLVIEAVFERLDIKQQVFAQVEAVVGDECVLMTNTSSLSVTRMAENLAHPERLVGFHFFNPVAVMPLIEVVRTPATDDATVATALAVGKQLKKSCVLVKDAPAFVVNRLLTRFSGEVVRAFDEGTPIDVVDAAVAPLGLPMSPFLLMQLVGPAILHHVDGSLNAAFPDRFRVSDNLGRIVEAGLPGVASWDADGRPSLSAEVAALLQFGDTVRTPEQVREGALEALADEVRRMLDEGVVAEPQDIDLCMIIGAGWPFHLGGLTPYLDRTGIAEKVTGRRFLPPGVASLPR
jgi:3-hydroxyacyl-CoA dehydrogenase/enoyl-CoA hydratase/carnithine racemase